MRRNVLAIDLGASSGRAMLGIYEDCSFALTEIHRFTYDPIMIKQKMHWNVDLIFEEICISIKKTLLVGKIHSLAIDTWGVDYGLLDEDGMLLEPPVHYRDDRTKGMLEVVLKMISKEMLYEMTGNQLMEINTLFQLKSMALYEPDKFKKAMTVLLMPDLFNYLLTGKRQTEVSIGSTTGLLNPNHKNWNPSLLETLDIPSHLFTSVVKEGNLLGLTKKELGFPEIPVYHVCSHDTASAFVSGADGVNRLFISCGTWSLIGVELPAPVLSKQSRTHNLTNESGVDGTTRLLKNVTGLWLIQELKREYQRLGKVYSYADFEALARKERPFLGFIDTEDERFLEAGGMCDKIDAYLLETGQDVPVSAGSRIRLVYESLALKYRQVMGEISHTIGRDFTGVNMVGGGIQSQLLCEMVADATALKVMAGPVEATALGNIAIQLRTLGCLKDLKSIREWIHQVSEFKVYQPVETHIWEEAFVRYLKVIGGNMSC